MIGTNDDLLLTIAVNVANDWWSRDIGIEILRPTGPAYQLGSIPPAEIDFVAVCEAEHVDMIVVIGIDRDHGGIVEPAVFVDKVRVRFPLTPEDLAVIVEDRFVRWKQIAPLSARNEDFIKDIAIDIGGMDINAELVGAGHELLVLAKLFVEHPFTPEAVR